MKILQRKQHSGITLIELMLVLAILGVLMSIAYPSYQRYKVKVDNAIAVSDITTIATAIDRYFITENQYPNTLANIGMSDLKDPWGNPYQYLPFDVDTKRGVMRKDKNLVPVNSDYDLYSLGENGTSAKPFTSKPGRDDIVRANNGRFIGPAHEY